MTSKMLIPLLILTTLLPQAVLLGQTTSATAKLVTTEGLELLRAGQAAQAKIKFDSAIKAAPQSPDVYTWRGICENQLDEYAAAAKDFLAALRINPALLAAHYNLALAYIRLHETNRAIEQFKIVINAQPNVVLPRYNLAILLEGESSFAEAIQELDVAHTLDANDKGVALHLLTNELKMGRSIQPSSLINDIADPSTPAAIQQQAGAAFVQAGHFDPAIKLLESAWHREPSSPGLAALLAQAYMGDGKSTEAKALLQAIPAMRRTPEETYLLALAYTGAGEQSEAAQTFQAAAHLDPNDARPLYQLGLLAAASSNRQAASADYLRAALRLDPQNPVYLLALARILLITDQAEEAKSLLSTIPVKAKDAAQINALKGVAAAATHDIEGSIVLLRKATEEDPSLALAHNVLGFCLFQQGHYAEAAQAYGTASSLEPNRLLYARDSALAFERANQPTQALHFAEQANALPKADASDHLLLGKLYIASGRNADAIRELQRAAELDVDLDAACYLLARTYMQMGDRSQATVWNDRLTALKQRHTADLALQKKSVPIRSSTLLQGGTLNGDPPGTP